MMGILDVLKQLIGRADDDEPQAVLRLSGYEPGAMITVRSSGKAERVSVIRHLRKEADFCLQNARDTVRQWVSYERGNLFAYHLVPGVYGIPSWWGIRYSGGASLEGFSSLIDEYVDQCERCNSIFRKRYPELSANCLEDVGSIYPAPLLHLGWLICLGATKDQVRRFVSVCGEPGQDRLFDLLVQKYLGEQRVIAASLVDPAGFGPTLRLIEGEADARSQLKKVMKSWFETRAPNISEPKPGDAGYVGFWAVDVAAMCYLWNMDDADVVGHPNYPTDLVEFARARRSC